MIFLYFIVYCKVGTKPFQQCSNMSRWRLREIAPLPWRTHRDLFWLAPYPQQTKNQFLLYISPKGLSTQFGLKAKQTGSVASAGQLRAVFLLWVLSITQLTAGPTCLSSEKLGNGEEQTVEAGYGRRGCPRLNPQTEHSQQSLKAGSHSSTDSVQNREASHQRMEQTQKGHKSSCAELPTPQLCQAASTQHLYDLSGQGCSDFSATAPVQDS